MRQWLKWTVLMMLPAHLLAAVPESAVEKTLSTPIAPEKLKRYYADLDQDGVADALDECPNTPAGIKVDSLGCALDSDRDGIADELDQCLTAEKGQVNFLGCIADTDRDGVDDSRDQCSDTPLGRQVNRHGCEAHDHRTLHLTFATGKYALLPGMRRQIDAALLRLQDLQPGQVILIEGHTDTIGCQDDNLRLSWNRAEAVREYLVNERGYPAEKVYVAGFGERHPTASNLTPQGRAQNRRIELKVVPRDQLPEQARLQTPDQLRGYVRRPGRCPLPDAR